MENDEDEGKRFDIEEFKKTAVLELGLDQLSVPIFASIEESKLALVLKNILVNLLQDIKRDADTGEFMIPPDLLPVFRELRTTLKDIYNMTESVSKEVTFKKVDVLKDLILKDKLKLKEEDKLSLIKSLSKESNDTD